MLSKDYCHIYRLFARTDAIEGPFLAKGKQSQRANTMIHFLGVLLESALEELAQAFCHNFTFNHFIYSL